MNFIHHVGIFSNDAGRLIQFYKEKFGFKNEPAQILPESVVRPIFGISCECEMFRLTLDGAVLEIFQPAARDLLVEGKTPAGCNHWALVVEDKVKFCAQLEEKGASVIKVNRGEHIVYFVADPDGNKIEIRS